MKVTLLYALLVINKGTCGAVCRMSLCWIPGPSTWSGTKDKEERHQKPDRHTRERKWGGGGGGVWTRRRETEMNGRFRERNGQEAEKEAETIERREGSRQKKEKRTDFHADRLSAHSPVPKLCRSQSRALLQ